MGKKEDESPWWKKKLIYQSTTMDNVSKKVVTYSRDDENQLEADIYSLNSLNLSLKVPAVIFVMGYSDSMFTSSIGMSLKDVEQYQDWAKLVASRGMIAITYQTQDPLIDLEQLMNFIQKYGGDYNIDTENIGLWSCSGNVPLAQYVLYQPHASYVRCAVFYYGFIYSTISSNTIDEASKRIKFAYPFTNEGNKMLYDVPLFIVRAGLDTAQDLNDTIDSFIQNSINNGNNLTFVNYSSGQHTFDVLDNNRHSKHIINQTMLFLEMHLLYDIDS